MANVTDDERERICALLREGKSVGQVARESGRAKGTVSKIAADAGISLDRSAVKNALEAQAIDNAARRADLIAKLLNDAHRMREQLWQPVLVYNFGGKENTYNEHTLAEPDFGGKRALMTAIGIAIDKVVALERHERNMNGDDSVEGKGALAAFMDVVRANADEYASTST
jgi:hypothetical protein